MTPFRTSLSRLLTFGAMAAAALACFILPAYAENTFSGNGTGTTTLSYYIPSMRYAGQPAFEFASVTSDKASSVLKFYSAAAPVAVTLATNASQVVLYCVPVGITNANVVVVRNLTADTYQRLVVSSATSTSLTFTANLANASVVGDLVYLETAAGTIPIGTNTVTLGPSSWGFWFGQKNRPALVEVDGTSACAINSISGRYLP
jgi:hypothetical protein